MVKKRYTGDRDFSLKKRLHEIWKVFYLFLVAENIKKISNFVIGHIPSMILLIVFISVYFAGGDIAYFRSALLVKQLFFIGAIFSCVLSIIYPNLFKPHLDKARILHLQFRQTSLSYGKLIFDSYAFLVSQLFYMSLFLIVGAGLEIQFSSEQVVEMLLLTIAFTLLYTNVLSLVRLIRSRYTFSKSIFMIFGLVIVVGVTIAFYTGGYMLGEPGFTDPKVAIQYGYFRNFADDTSAAIAILPGTNWWTSIGIFFGLDWYVVLIYAVRVVISSYFNVKMYSKKVVASQTL